MEASSSQWATQGYNGMAVSIFGGLDTLAQTSDGPQYVATWTQTNSTPVTTNSIDFSGTQPRTDGSSVIELDAVPVGTLLDKKTQRQIEIRFASQLVAGESVQVNYRTDLEFSWLTAGVINSETWKGNGEGSPLTQMVGPITFEKVQMIQLQLVLTSTTTNPSWCRIQGVFLK
jgi:hypothetical protein